MQQKHHVTSSITPAPVILHSSTQIMHRSQSNGTESALTMFHVRPRDLHFGAKTERRKTWLLFHIVTLLLPELLLRRRRKQNNKQKKCRSLRSQSWKAVRMQVLSDKCALIMGWRKRFGLQPGLF